MRPTEFWLWWLTGPTGKRYKSRHRMTADQAPPGASRVEGTREVRLLPESDAEAVLRCSTYLSADAAARLEVVVAAEQLLRAMAGGDRRA